MSDQCAARKRQEPHDACKRPAGWGTDHPGVGCCKYHGGASPSGKKAAATVKAEREVRALAAQYLADAPAVVNPLERLLGLAGETDAWLAAARTRVGQLLDEDALTTWSETGEDVKALVKVYERALDRTHSMLASLAKLDIEKRLTAIAERDHARLEHGVEAAWLAGKRGEDLEAARRAFAGVLRP
jgi:hypothetical protein